MNGQPDDRELAIRTIASETSGRSPEETLGIAAVIANRLKTGKWGSTLGDVVLARNQFEPWNTPGGRNDPMNIDPRSRRYQDAAMALDAALQGQDPTGGATHFFAPAAQAALGRQPPAWGRSGGQQIGATAFYAPEGRVQSQGGAMQIKWDDEPAQSQLPANALAFGPGAAAAAPIPPQRPSAMPQSQAPLDIKWDDVQSPQVTMDKPSPYGALPSGQFGEQDPAVQAVLNARKPGMPETFVRGAAQGVSMNFGDEIAAAHAASGLPVLPGMAKVMTPHIGVGRMALERLAPSIFGTSATEAYNRTVQEQRDANAAAQFANPGTYIAGNIVGGVAVPAGGAAAVGARAGMAAGARAGAGIGAASGFGEGESLPERLQQGAVGGAIGGVAGGALGAVAGRIGQGGASQPNAVVQSAENLGVTVPKAVASDSTAVQRIGQAVRNVPLSGDKIVKAVQSTNEQLGDVAGNVAGSLGSGDIVTAGQAAGGAIRNWITGRSSQAVTKAYDAVDTAVNPNTLTPLGATQQKVADILASRQASRISDPGSAVKFVADAVQDPNGLTYAGIKGLRTRVGEMLDNPNLMPAGTSQAELKQIYGALTDDLRSAVTNAGGQRGAQLWERANKLNAMVQERRGELAKIVGIKGDVPDEKVFGRIQQLAASGTKGDIDLLVKARRAMGSQEWDEVSSAVVANLGRDPSGAFSPDRFVTAMSKLSDSGKSALFQPAHRQALNDIQTISERLQQVGRRFGNPSGTAQQLTGAGIMGGALTNPVATIGAVVGGGVMARVLASPATASSLAKWSRAYEMAVTKPSAATVSGLQVASRNFASTIGDKLGVQTSAQEILKLVQKSANASPADYSPEADMPAQGAIQNMDLSRAPKLPRDSVIIDERSEMERDIDGIRLGDLRKSNMFLEDLTPEIKARVLRKMQRVNEE